MNEQTTNEASLPPESQEATSGLPWTKDKTVNRVVNKMRQRSALGLTKYGTPLSENPLPFLSWLIHLQEELMDASLYAERLMQELESETSSAESLGLATKPLEWLAANPDIHLMRLIRVITDFSRLTPSTPVESRVMCPDSSTLQLTLRWPTPFTSIPEDGALGLANPEERRR